MKKILAILVVLLLSGCGGDFQVAQATPNPIYINIQGKNNIISNMTLNAKTVKTAVATQIASGQAALRIELTDKGAKALYAITTTNIGRRLTVYWQGTIISNSLIDSPLGGSTMMVVLVLPDSTPSDIQSMIATITTQDKSMTN